MTFSGSGKPLPIFAILFSSPVINCAIVTSMPFSRPKKRSYSEDELYEYAVGALARRMRTVAELKRLLRARLEDAESEYGQTLIQLVIRRLKDRGYLNDSQYAAYFSSLRRDNQKFGRGRVVTDLKVKGVHGDVIEKAVDAAFEGVSEERQAREYLRRKRVVKPKDQKMTARVFRQLARAGFGAKTIFSILKSWDVDEETLSSLESEIA
ncbi:MAG TPA: regulatory protein RecX [Candidatus Polarisedimenticolia bacterium]|nr:regulatory protein RecX [Candidatus Polarisedimenticolia bacterium]